MTRAGRLAALAVVASILLAINEIPAWPFWLLVVVAAVAIAWWLMSGFWATVAIGAAGGVLAGLVILGPGLRGAMRMVAVLDAFRSPEFSVGGTVFVILVAGGVMGGIFGIVGNLLRSATNLRSYSSSGIASGLLLTAMLLVIFGGEFDLGGGLWVNLGVFGMVSIVYGVAAMRLVDRFSSRTASQPEPEIVRQT